MTRNIIFEHTLFMSLCIELCGGRPLRTRAVACAILLRARDAFVGRSLTASGLSSPILERALLFVGWFFINCYFDRPLLRQGRLSLRVVSS